MTSADIKLHDLIDLDSIEDVRSEVRLLTDRSFPGIAMPSLDCCFYDVIRMFQGRFTGYQQCTTEYHDLHHTMDVLLTTARLLHSCMLSGYGISPRGAELVLIAALMHDIGYIQEEGDEGTGGKYTFTHVERSAAFLESHGHNLGLSDDEVGRACCMITATSLAIPLSSICYGDTETELLAKLLASADLLGQLADRLYLERLLFLFNEFSEAGVMGITHEFDLLNQTHGFYAMVRRRLDEDLDGLDCTLRLHFRDRWQIDRDLYEESITANLRYLEVVINETRDNYRSKLKRGGVVERLTPCPTDKGTSS